jgi:Tfp pilus assembly ATPase PilU
MFVTPLFKLMSDKQASDMFFTAGAPIQIRRSRNSKTSMR